MNLCCTFDARRKNRPGLKAGSYMLCGTRWLCCGPSAAQQQLSAEQNQFYTNLNNSYATTYAGQQNILNSLTAEFQPILAAGPNQEGFSAQEETALNTQAAESTAAGAQEAQVALGNKEAAQGGGAAIPSGAQEELSANIDTSAGNEEAALRTQITEADYQQGLTNFNEAAGVLGNTAALENPTGVAGAATSAGSAAETTANQIAQEETAWMQPIFGAIGGIGGAALGNPNFKF